MTSVMIYNVLSSIWLVNEIEDYPLFTVKTCEMDNVGIMSHYNERM